MPVPLAPPSLPATLHCRLTGFLDACPAARAAEYLLFADQYTYARGGNLR